MGLPEVRFKKLIQYAYFGSIHVGNEISAMPLLDRFKKFVEENNLYHPGERVLLAVSGGVDSVVMLDLARRAGWRAGIGHCNFQLRGAASDGDEDFVRDLAEAQGLPVHVAVFETRGEAARRGISIQMAARDLRYGWFEEIRRQEGYDRIATAHHLDDSVETALLNFVKGTGLRGLHGIPVRRQTIIRPILFAAKAELEAYAGERGLSFRTDVSNEELYYARNKIRHQVIPVLKELNPSFEQTAAANLERFREAEFLYEWALEHIIREVKQVENDRITIDLDRLLYYYRAAPTILFEIIYPYGFHPNQITQVLDSSGRQSGALFFSDTHQLLVDRETLILEPRIFDTEEKEYYIAEGAETVYLPDGKISVSYYDGQPDAFPSNPNRAMLDAGKLQFPLRLRHWRRGDYFHPLGMNGQRQKLQDFFTNQKIPRLDKDRVWLLENGQNHMCWIVGYRIDERFKITPQTTQYLIMEFQPY
jgi:tRNA(Ile)-lysidine synthase